MSRRAWGLIVLLLGSVAIGVGSGHYFFGIFKETVPPAVLTTFNENAAYGYFLFRGAMVGILLFAWSLASVLLSKMFGAGPSGRDAGPRVS